MTDKSNKILYLKDTSDESEVKHTASYQFDGITFIVEPVFKKRSAETLGSILLRLMMS